MSIAATDRSTPRDEGDTKSLFGARAAAWWDVAAPTAVTPATAPRREMDQSMRVVLAPYIDGQGDYHERSEVYAVMRKAQWLILPPATPPATREAVTASQQVPEADGDGS